MDKNGNITIGVKEINVFPEVESFDLNQLFGLEVTLVANKFVSKEVNAKMLELMGVPFIKETKKLSK